MNQGDSYEYVIYVRVPVALADTMESATFTIGMNQSSTRIAKSVDSEGVYTFYADNWHRISK